MDLLIEWFEENRRDLPWRKNPTPYAVWVSEVMLQQTQAAVVIPYFIKWMERFPTIEALAGAKEEEVIKTWEGLGYYSRARHLHSGAKEIVKRFYMALPSSQKDLLSIKGIGPYTAGAIQSFAFKKRAAAVDGNVARVIARLKGVTENVTSPKGLKLITEHVEKCLPKQKAWIAMEGLIELGALVCKKKPDCKNCPLIDQCVAYREGKESLLPSRGKTTATIQLIRQVHVIEENGAFLVRQEREKKVMQGLFEFPYFERKDQSVHNQVENWLGAKCRLLKKWPSLDHTFTKYRVKLFPFHWEIAKRVEIPGYEWKKKEEMKQLPFSGGHRTICQWIGGS